MVCDDCLEACADGLVQMTKKARMGLMTACVSFMFFLSYLVIAIEGVEPTEYALVQENMNKEFVMTEDGKPVIFDNGVHMTGVMKRLILYPSTGQNIEFSDSQMADQTELKTRTKEGLELSVHCAFQYKLVREEIKELYKIAKLDYAALYQRLARNIILKVAGDFEAHDWWLKRNEIG